MKFLRLKPTERDTVENISSMLREIGSPQTDADIAHQALHDGLTDKATQLHAMDYEKGKEVKIATIQKGNGEAREQFVIVTPEESAELFDALYAHSRLHPRKKKLAALVKQLSTELHVC